MVSASVVTERPSIAPARYWRYRQTADPAFDAVVFDEDTLKRLEMIEGTAPAGRGNTFFINYHGCELVLRHYRRGGMAQHISTRHYVYTGLENTRAMREFDVLERLHELQLPAPIPYACQVIRHGLFYSASLVTHRLSGRTLAQHVMQGDLADQTWASIGATIAGFHRAGINHADLNAHNIMLDTSDRVALIDFDRARILPSPTGQTHGWCQDNILRLRRSLNKLTSKPATSDGFGLLQNAWQSALSQQ